MRDGVLQRRIYQLTIKYIIYMLERLIDRIVYLRAELDVFTVDTHQVQNRSCACDVIHIDYTDDIHRVYYCYCYCC